MGRWFGKAESGIDEAASQTFETTEEFEEKLYEHLHAILGRRIGAEELRAAIRWYQLLAAE
jgi:hypothetical protein